MELALEAAISNGWKDDGSLPNKWEEQVDTSTGQKFFIDHNSHSTSWVDPRDYLHKPHSFEQCIGDELPYGWEIGMDPEVGQYFINHIEWSTHIDDPRKHAAIHDQRAQLAAFLRATEARVREQRTQARLREESLRVALRELAAIRSKLRLASLYGEPTVDLTTSATSAEYRAAKLREELEAIQAEMDYDVQGLRILQDISHRTAASQQYSVEEGRRALHELRRLHELTASRARERHNIEELLIHSTGMEQQIALNEELQRQLEALRQDQKLLDAGQNTTTNNENLLELVRLKQEEKSHLESATDKMADLLLLHEEQARNLTKQVEALKAENEVLRARMERIAQLRQAESEFIEKLQREGVSLSTLDGFVSKAALAEQISQLTRLSEKDKAELWAELEATSDIFMPKTKLESILKSHEAQLDELRRLLTVKPADEHVARRTWNQDMQQFEETPLDRSAVPTSVELELALVAARQEALEMQRDIDELTAMRKSLVDAEALYQRLSQQDLVAGGAVGAAGAAGAAGGVSVSSGPEEGVVDAADVVVQTEDGAAGAQEGTAKKTTRRSQVDGATGLMTPVRRFQIGHLDPNVASPLSPATADFLLDGESWMLNPKTQDMLGVREEAKRRIATLRAETHAKVSKLRTKVIAQPGKLSFQEKILYFTTAGVNLHRDITEAETSHFSVSTTPEAAAEPSRPEASRFESQL